MNMELKFHIHYSKINFSIKSTPGGSCSVELISLKYEDMFNTYSISIRFEIMEMNRNRAKNLNTSIDFLYINAALL